MGNGRKNGKKELVSEKRELAKPLPTAPGTEEITSDDIVMPRLRLLQATSEEVESGKSKAGVLRHSLTGEEISELEFIPICLKKMRMLFDRENSKSPPLCFSLDGKVTRDGKTCPCEKTYWKNDKAPECSLVYTYPSLMLKKGKIEKGALVAIPFAKSSATAAQKLNSIVALSTTPMPFWNKVYQLTTKLKKFQKGNAYVLEITSLRDSNETEREIASDIYQGLANRKVEIEIGQENN